MLFKNHGKMTNNLAIILIILFKVYFNKNLKEIIYENKWTSRAIKRGLKTMSWRSDMCAWIFFFFLKTNNSLFTLFFL